MSKEIKNYEGLYKITTDGSVYSVRRDMYLNPTINKGGYCVVDLFKDGKRTHAKVHRLVAQAFLDNEKNYTHVDHINRIKTDNRLINLRWCSASESAKNTKKTLNPQGGIHVWKNKNTYSYRATIRGQGIGYHKYFTYTDEGYKKAEEWLIEKRKELNKL